MEPTEGRDRCPAASLGDRDFTNRLVCLKIWRAFGVGRWSRLGLGQYYTGELPTQLTQSNSNGMPEQGESKTHGTRAAFICPRSLQPSCGW